VNREGKDEGVTKKDRILEGRNITEIRNQKPSLRKSSVREEPAGTSGPPIVSENEGGEGVQCGIPRQPRGKEKGYYRWYHL